MRQPLLKTETNLYDDMSKGHVDASKWRILSFPMGNGENWVWEEPKAKIASRNGGLGLTVDPFTRKHDKIHMFDDPKQCRGFAGRFRGPHTHGLRDWHDLRLHHNRKEDRSNLRATLNPGRDRREDRVHLPRRSPILRYPNKTGNDASLHGQNRRAEKKSGMDCRWKGVLQVREPPGSSKGHSPGLGTLHTQAC